MFGATIAVLGKSDNDFVDQGGSMASCRKSFSMIDAKYNPKNVVIHP